MSFDSEDSRKAQEEIDELRGNVARLTAELEAIKKVVADAPCECSPAAPVECSACDIRWEVKKLQPKSK